MRLLRYGGLLAALGIAGLAGGVFWLQGQGVTPRALGPYLERRAEGHNPLVTDTGQWLNLTLRGLDRGADAGPYPLPPLAVGAQAAPSGSGAGAQKPVATVEEARDAFAAALSGDVITFAPGVYRVRDAFEARRPGVEGVPVVVRAEQPGSVVLEFEAGEGFKVAAPYWRFENLEIRGACRQPEYCHHAFHVTGKARGFAAVNNTIVDFNAHFKINGDKSGYPDAGLIEGNTLTNTAPRRVYGPVTPIDLVAANDWTIRANLITDFIKDGGDRVSYGAFAKGAAARTLFERNVVLCEHKLRGMPGERVGLSFGGGATGKQYCRDGRCITEHDAGVMRANLIASCSDAGIYINSGAGTRIVDNTLLDTAGVQVRFPESSATLEGNLIDGAAVARNGARLSMGDNRSTSIAALYAGLHAQRGLFAEPGILDLHWKDGAPRRDTAAAPGVDLCGVKRPAQPAYGAFEDFAACLKPRN
ncbi:right-handed parallel beta-helix repeat-containing protein [Massilia niastensis]|uniref:right-handed parallel beta-helix repeat-containing protein n=1 Tax=Massilia niastensis TaxID=544911 RepID=UPI0012EBAFCA|nr:right-handed parallel beta-helix repeat-containing protein [Massilia niastensis]